MILGVTVTPGDVHDSVPYLDHLEQIHRNVFPIQAATADAAYDFPLAHRVLEEQGISFYVRPQPFACLLYTSQDKTYQSDFDRLTEESGLVNGQTGEE